MSGQAGKGHFRGITLPGEHRFPEEAFPQADTIKPTGQLAIAPGLDGMGIAASMESAIGLNHLRRNPGTRVMFPWNLGARVNYPFEVRIERNREAILSHDFLQRF